MLILMPAFAMIVGFALAIVILAHYAAAPARRVHELVWGISFWMFGLGALAEVVGDLIGWHDLLARVYYISGAILAVAYLGLGEAILLWPGRAARVSMIVGAAFTVITVVALLAAPLDASVLHSDVPWRAVAAKGSLPAILAGLSNSIGTLLIVGGALYSAWVFWRKGIQRNRMIGCVLLAVGTLVVATGGVLAGWLNQHAWLYPPMALGVAIMFVGYLQTTRAPAPKPIPQPS
ncbi:MAG TPA: hypothetical protein VKY74_16890 [Chloroflexia bacterium]|nr:hypothetical protein [Chloroflexia bacterium]